MSWQLAGRPGGRRGEGERGGVVLRREGRGKRRRSGKVGEGGRGRWGVGRGWAEKKGGGLLLFMEGWWEGGGGVVGGNERGGGKEEGG